MKTRRWKLLHKSNNRSFQQFIKKLFQKSEKDKTSKKELQARLNEFVENTKKTFTKELYERGAIGSIAEVYDSKAPYLPKGTIAQGWSVAEIFRIIKEDL